MLDEGEHVNATNRQELEESNPVDARKETGAAFYCSTVSVEPMGGPDRRAILPPNATEVVYGVHGEIAAHYRVDIERIAPRSSTLDHVVAATAACLGGTFGSMLRARKVRIDSGALETVATGSIEVADGVLVIRRISVAYRLVAPSEQHAAVERAHALHVAHCPVARSLEGAIAIETSLTMILPAE